MNENKHTVLITDLRKQLKELLASELKKLPEYLNDLQSKEKLDCLIKLMPFVFPKLDSITYEDGEPGEFEIKGWR
jgi:hypothetical protein